MNKKSVYATKAFWKGAGERAVKTFAQSLLGTFVVGVPLFDLDILAGLAIAGTATAASILTAIASPDFTAGENTNGKA